MTDTTSSLIEKLKHEADFMTPQGKAAIERAIVIIRQYEAEQNTAQVIRTERESTREGHGRMVVGGSDTLNELPVYPVGNTKELKAYVDFAAKDGKPLKHIRFNGWLTGDEAKGLCRSEIRDNDGLRGLIFNAIAKLQNTAPPNSSLANLLPSHRADIANAIIATIPKREDNFILKKIAFTCERTGRRWEFESMGKFIEAFLNATQPAREMVNPPMVKDLNLSDEEIKRLMKPSGIIVVEKSKPKNKEEFSAMLQEEYGYNKKLADLMAGDVAGYGAFDVA